MEEPPEESLPYTGEDDDETAVTFNIDPEEEQKLLGVEKEEDDVPRHCSPSLLNIQEASAHAPSDTRQYEYAHNVQGTMESRYFKGGDPSQELAIAVVKQDLPSSSDDPSGPPPRRSLKLTNEPPQCCTRMCRHRQSPSRCHLGWTDICDVFVFLFVNCVAFQNYLKRCLHF